VTPSRKFPKASPAFPYVTGRNGKATLYCGQVPLSRLAERFGTPLYVYSATEIIRRISAFEDAFEAAPHTICYSVKANSNLAILHLLAKQGCGFDIVSGGELQRIQHVSPHSMNMIVFSGVGKTADEIEAALKAGILLFNVESESELGVLADSAARARRPARIAFRVNPDVPTETHPYISTGLREHKFGIPITEATRLYTQASKSEWLQVAGVSVHIGSQITEPKPFAAAMERVANLVLDLRALGHRIKYVDAGGGLGISYTSRSAGDFVEEVGAYARALLRPLRGLNIHLLLEPGRSIIGPAGVLLTRVTYRKKNGEKNFLVVDAGMNDLIRPSLYQAHHEIVPVDLNPEAKREISDVVGPVCETGDFFARDRALPEAEEGDLLAILDTGAYGMSLASNYNSRPRPAEVMVQGKMSKLIRKRETFRDLIRGEEAPS
jgi:diaminopimelate decarboxylase